MLCNGGRERCYKISVYITAYSRASTICEELIWYNGGLYFTLFGYWGFFLNQGRLAYRSGRDLLLTKEPMNLMRLKFPVLRLACEKYLPQNMTLLPVLALEPILQICSAVWSKLKHSTVYGKQNNHCCSTLITSFLSLYFASRPILILRTSLNLKSIYFQYLTSFQG